MQEQIDSLVSLLSESQQLNYKRWGIDQRTLRERVLHSTYNEYINDLRDYVTKHIAYINEVLSPYVPDESDEPVDAIESPQPAETDYALAYNLSGDYLHFGAEDPAALTFMAHLYDGAGRLVRTFRASEGCSLQRLPRGLYTVSWTIQGRQRSVKFIK